MDLLGSILGTMEKPPTATNEQRKSEKARKEKLEKLQDQERKYKADFRKTIENKVTDIMNNVEKSRLELEPMNKIQRSIVHDIAEIAGLVTHAFGKEEEGRYMVIFKKDSLPSEEELVAYRKGEKYDPEAKAKEKTEQVKSKQNVVFEEIPSESTVSKKSQEPNSNYKDKYRHIIGTSSAKDAARKTEANKAFGMVPSENKRDLRSIEETMNEIQKKKKLKLEDNSN